MKSLPIQQSTGIMKLLTPRSMSYHPPSQIYTCNHQLCSSSTQHLTSRTTADNVNDETVDNILANMTSTQRIGHQGNNSNSVNTIRSISTSNSPISNVLHQSNTLNLANSISPKLPDHNVSTEVSIHQHHVCNIFEDATSNIRDVDFYQFTIQSEFDSVPSQHDNSILKIHLQDPQNETQSTLNYDTKDINTDIDKNYNYDNLNFDYYSNIMH